MYHSMDSASAGGVVLRACGIDGGGIAQGRVLFL
jgi:hypothetical protein